MLDVSESELYVINLTNIVDVSFAIFAIMKWDYTAWAAFATGEAIHTKICAKARLCTPTCNTDESSHKS